MFNKGLTQRELADLLKVTPKGKNDSKRIHSQKSIYVFLE